MTERVIEERIILCCGAKDWTKVIAWLQMIVCTTLSLHFFISIVGLLHHAFNNDGKMGPTETSWILAVRTILWFTHCLGTIMGFVLLQGSRLTKIEYLRWWILWALLAFIIHLVLSVSSLIVDDLPPNFYIPGALAFGAVCGFCIWVVRIHAKEIRTGIVDQDVTQV